MISNKTNRNKKNRDWIWQIKKIKERWNWKKYSFKDYLKKQIVIKRKRTKYDGKQIKELLWRNNHTHTHRLSMKLLFLF